MICEHILYPSPSFNWGNTAQNTTGLYSINYFPLLSFTSMVYNIVTRNLSLKIWPKLFGHTSLLDYESALTRTLLWPRITQQQAKVCCQLKSQSLSRLWKEPDHIVAFHPDTCSTAGLASGGALQRAVTDSHRFLLRENRERSDRTHTTRTHWINVTTKLLLIQYNKYDIQSIFFCL